MDPLIVIIAMVVVVLALITMFSTMFRKVGPNEAMIVYGFGMREPRVVKSDPDSIRTASEQFLNKTPQERENLIRLVMEGHLRGIVGQLSVEEIVKQPEMVADK